MNNFGENLMDLLTDRPNINSIKNSIPSDILKIKTQLKHTSSQNQEMFYTPNASQIQSCNPLIKYKMPKLIIRKDASISSSVHVENAYNHISDFSNRAQIITAIQKLNTVQQRVKLIDRILVRKDEMKHGIEKVQMQILNPLFQKFKHKCNEKGLSSTKNEQSQTQHEVVRITNFGDKIGTSLALQWIIRSKGSPNAKAQSQTMMKSINVNKVSQVSNMILQQANQRANQSNFKRKMVQIDNVQAKIVNYRVSKQE